MTFYHSHIPTFAKTISLQYGYKAYQEQNDCSNRNPFDDSKYY